MTDTSSAPTAGHNSATALSDCATSIRNLVAREQAAAGDNLLLGIDIGRAIENARRILGDGGPLFDWVEKQAGVKKRQANTYIALFKNEADLRAAVKWVREPGVQVDPKLLHKERAKQLIAAHKAALEGRESEPAPAAQTKKGNKKRLEVLLTFAAQQRRIEALEAALRDEDLPLPREDAEDAGRRELARAALAELPALMAAEEHGGELQAEDNTEENEDGAEGPASAAPASTTVTALMLVAPGGGRTLREAVARNRGSVKIAVQSLRGPMPSAGFGAPVRSADEEPGDEYLGGERAGATAQPLAPSDAPKPKATPDTKCKAGDAARAALKAAAEEARAARGTAL